MRCVFVTTKAEFSQYAVLFRPSPLKIATGMPNFAPMTLTSQDSAFFTDFYQLTMSRGYFAAGISEDSAVFEYHFRRNPFGGGYAIFAGLGDLLETLSSLRFGPGELDFLRAMGFDEEFVGRLKRFRFRGELWAMREGEVVFPFEPIVRVKAPLIEGQLIETILLNTLNFQTLVATKAMRMRYVAGERTLMEFGLRRAHGLGGLQASRAALVGGFDATSNVLAAKRFGINVAGTMAHAWVQAFEDELTAFRRYAQTYPDKTTLLIDTYDVLRSGVPNAIAVAKELRAQGKELYAVRLDSGDLAYLSKKARHALDEAGFPNVKIIATNDLDERLIASLIQQSAPIDGYGVGTKLVTAYDQPALGGVYKILAVKGKPRIKISENVIKMTLPGAKTAWRYVDEAGMFMADGVGPENALAPSRIYHPFEAGVESTLESYKPTPLLEKAMAGGKPTGAVPSVADAAAYARARFALLPDEHKRFENPHVYRVGVAKQTLEIRNRLVKKYQTGK